MAKRMRLRHYYQAIEMLKFMEEGHNYRETAEKFVVHPSTVKNRLNTFKEFHPDKYQKLIEEGKNKMS